MRRSKPWSSACASPATILDVLQAQLSWIQLYTNAIKAHYNYAVAVSDYRRITAQQ